jgi:hypothetical protein
VPTAIAAAADHGRLRGRRLIYAALAAPVGVLAILALGALTPRRVPSLDDAVLLRGVLSATPRWTAPALAWPGGERALGHDALVGLGLVLAVLAIRVARGPRLPRPAGAITAASVAILGLAVAIGQPLLAVDDPQGLGFRLRLAAFVPCALAAAILARAVRLPHKELALAALAAGLVALRQPGPRLEGEIETSPALVTACLALAGHVPPGATLIVPERHIAFMAAWYTGAAVALSPDRVPPWRRYRLLPLHFIGEGSALDRLLVAARDAPGIAPPLGVHPRHPNGLVLVAEPTWLWALAQLPDRERAAYAAWPTI